MRPYTWPAIKKHRENYNEYKMIYKSTLRSPNDIELKLDLQKCEDSLPIVSVIIAREQAKFEVSHDIFFVPSYVLATLALRNLNLILLLAVF